MTESSSLAIVLLLTDKQVFAKLDVVGWYATGARVEDVHMQIHRKASGCTDAAAAVHGICRQRCMTLACFLPCNSQCHKKEQMSQRG